MARHGICGTPFKENSPRLAKKREYAFPMPPPAPVMMATRPSNLSKSVICFFVWGKSSFTANQPHLTRLFLHMRCDAIIQIYYLLIWLLSCSQLSAIRMTINWLDPKRNFSTWRWPLQCDWKDYFFLANALGTRGPADPIPILEALATTLIGALIPSPPAPSPLPFSQPSFCNNWLPLLSSWIPCRVGCWVTCWLDILSLARVREMDWALGWRLRKDFIEESEVRRWRTSVRLYIRIRWAWKADSFWWRSKRGMDLNLRRHWGKRQQMRPRSLNLSFKALTLAIFLSKTESGIFSASSTYIYICSGRVNCKVEMMIWRTKSSPPSTRPSLQFPFAWHSIFAIESTF